MSTQRQFLLGTFFLTALGILAFYTLFLTDFALFKDPIVLNVGFKEAHGLREGDPVTVKGLRAGRVKSLAYVRDTPDEYKIIAELHLDDELTLTEGASIVIKESTLLGGRQVDIFPGVIGMPPLLEPTAGYYRGDVAENPIQALGAVSEMIQENSEAIKNILDGVETVVDNASEGKGPIGRFFMDDTMAQELSDTVTDFRQIATEARQISEDINSGRGLIGQLLQDPELVAKFDKTLSNMEGITNDLREGTGLASRLIYDDHLAKDVERAIESFRSFGERMDAGQGILGKLMADEDLADDLQEIVTNMRTVTEDITVVSANVRNGEGSLGKLLMEPELYEEALTSVKLLTRSLEDYREAAPVSTFTSVLFSAF